MFKYEDNRKHFQKCVKNKKHILSQELTTCIRPGRASEVVRRRSSLSPEPDPGLVGSFRHPAVCNKLSDDFRSFICPNSKSKLRRICCPVTVTWILWIHGSEKLQRFRFGC